MTTSRGSRAHEAGRGLAQRLVVREPRPVGVRVAVHAVLLPGVEVGHQLGSRRPRLQARGSCRRGRRSAGSRRPTAGGMRNSDRREAGSGSPSSSRAWSSRGVDRHAPHSIPEAGPSADSSAITAGQAALAGSMGSKWPMRSSTTRRAGGRRSSRTPRRPAARGVSSAPWSTVTGTAGRGRAVGSRSGQSTAGRPRKSRTAPSSSPSRSASGEVGHRRQGEHAQGSGCPPGWAASRARCPPAEWPMTTTPASRRPGRRRASAARTAVDGRRRADPGVAGTRRARWGGRPRRARRPSAAGGCGRTPGARTRRGRAGRARRPVPPAPGR